MIEAKETMIYISEFLISLSFTVLSSFYPGMAENKGIPIWMIGLVFSTDPILGLPTSVWTGKYMTKFGRKRLLTFGLFLNSIATFLIGMLEFAENTEAITISFLSRFLAGIGAGLSMTTSSAILVIEYPQEIDRVIGLFEAASGLGLLLGPIIGSFLSSFQLSISFSLFALFFLVFAMFIDKFLAHGKGIEDSSANLPIRFLLSKPVKFKQKLLIDFCAQMWLMFSLGYLSTVIELHLRNYGLTENLVGLVYSICLLVYFVASVLETFLLRWFSGKLLTFIGILSTSIGFFLVGDIPIFPESILIISIGLAFIGLGGALMYIPTTSNIIYNSINIYKIEKSDKLVDSISSCTIFICNFGEILGPILAGILTEKYGYSTGFKIISGLSFVFFIVYFFAAMRNKRAFVGPIKALSLIYDKQKV